MKKNGSYEKLNNYGDGLRSGLSQILEQYELPHVMTGLGSIIEFFFEKTLEPRHFNWIGSIDYSVFAAVARHETLLFSPTNCIFYLCDHSQPMEFGHGHRRDFFARSNGNIWHGRLYDRMVG